MPEVLVTNEYLGALTAFSVGDDMKISHGRTTKSVGHEDDKIHLHCDDSSGANIKTAGLHPGLAVEKRVVQKTRQTDNVQAELQTAISIKRPVLALIKRGASIQVNAPGAMVAEFDRHDLGVAARKLRYDPTRLLPLDPNGLRKSEKR